MDTIPNGHNPECALISIYSYLSVVYVCLISTFYKDAFNKKLFSSKHSQTVRIRPQFHAVIVCYGFVIITLLQVKLSHALLFLLYDYADALKQFFCNRSIVNFWQLSCIWL